MPTTTTYKCFFITPMGDKDSETRKKSDRILKSVLRPALSQCGFSMEAVVRSDHLTGNIHETMMNHLRYDELCVADLRPDNRKEIKNEVNYNVMYEAGFRAGLGKPLIFIAPVGFDLPFDIKTERVVFYDVDSPDAIDQLPDTHEELIKQVSDFVKEGFLSSSGVGSVADITKRLDSIEKRLNDVLTNTSIAGPGTESDDVTNIVREMGSPIQAFNYALSGRNVQLAEALLPRLSASISKDYYIRAALAQTCALGSKMAAEILRSEWDYLKENYDAEQQYEILGCYVSYCNRRDLEAENLAFVRAEAERILKVTTDDAVKAGLYNQLNRIYYGAHQTIQKNGQDEKEYLGQAVSALEQATRLYPDEASYLYNLAICRDEQGNLNGAVEAIRKCLELNTDDADHLALAYNIFMKNGLPAEAGKARNKLHSVSPRRAAML